MNDKVKNILVVAPALRTSGGTTIYKQFLNHLAEKIGNNNYLVIKDETMPEIVIEGVRYVNVNTVSHIKRVLFDFYGCKKLIKMIGFNPDLVVSLQNTGVFCLKNIKQCVYYHSPVALFPYKWSLFDKEERNMLMYKYIYPIFVRLSTTRTTRFVVQTQYIKDAFVDYYKTNPENVSILFPDISLVPIDDVKVIEFPLEEFHFVYPATPKLFKKHETIVYALTKLREKAPEILRKIKIHFTLEKDSLPHLISLIHKSELEENFIFEGVLPLSKLNELYKSSIGLLFPSVVETLGLPLVEAASFGIPVLVSDAGYSHAVISKYEGATFIPPFEYEKWANMILSVCEKKPRYSQYNIEGNSSWIDFFNIIQS